MGLFSSSSKSKKSLASSSQIQLNETGVIALVRDPSVYSGRTLDSQSSNKSQKKLVGYINSVETREPDDSTSSRSNVVSTSHQFAPLAPSFSESVRSTASSISESYWADNASFMSAASNDRRSEYSTGSVAASSKSSMACQLNSTGYIPNIYSHSSKRGKSSLSTSNKLNSISDPSIKSQNSSKTVIYDQSYIEALQKKQSKKRAKEILKATDCKSTPEIENHVNGPELHISGPREWYKEVFFLFLVIFSTFLLLSTRAR